MIALLSPRHLHSGVLRRCVRIRHRKLVECRHCAQIFHRSTHRLEERHLCIIRAPSDFPSDHLTNFPDDMFRFDGTRLQRGDDAARFLEASVPSVDKEPRTCYMYCFGIELTLRREAAA